MAKPMKTDPAKLSALARMFVWVEDPLKVQRVVYGLYALCGFSILAELFYTKHPYFDVENLPGFYAIFGFAACLVLVFLGKWLRAALMRSDDYYAPTDVEAEAHPQDDLKVEDADV